MSSKFQDCDASVHPLKSFAIIAVSKTLRCSLHLLPSAAICLNIMSDFCSPTIHSLFGQRVVYANKDGFTRKLQGVVQAGAKSTMIVTDFDFTLTKHSATKGGARLCSCHKVLEDCGLLSETYHSTAKALQQKYYPLEMDPTIEMDRKVHTIHTYTLYTHTHIHTYT